MAESHSQKNEEYASPTPASSPDNLIKDLDARVSEADQNSVVGGKAGQDKHEYLIVKLNEVIITSV